MNFERVRAIVIVFVPRSAEPTGPATFHTALREQGFVPEYIRNDLCEYTRRGDSEALELLIDFSIAARTITPRKRGTPESVRAYLREKTARYAFFRTHRPPFTMFPRAPTTELPGA